VVEFFLLNKALPFMGKKLNLALLMGGPSAEHEVSLASGKEVMRHLDLKKYQVTPVVISKTGKWKIGDSIKLYTPTDALKQLQTLGIHVAFIALHGKFGEDGILQALLEEVGIRYTG